MVTVIRLAEIRDEPLSVDEVRAAAGDPGAGAIGAVPRRGPGSRPRPRGDRPVLQRAPVRGRRAGRVAEKIAASHPVRAIAVVHRTGDLQLGDLAVVAAVSADHRAEAFAACEALIDELKATVPIWKHQFFAGGESEWVNSA